MATQDLAPLKKTLRMARSRFLYGLEKTPDDRLHWSPAEGVATPLALAGKVVTFLRFSQYLIQHGGPPEGARPDLPEYADRQEAQTAVGAAFDRALAFVDGLTDEDLGRTLTPPWRTPASGAEFVQFLPVLVGYFQGQLNLLQACYGDADPNIPPGWGTE